MRITSGTTDQYVYFVAVDATDLKTRETGLSGFTVYRSRNGAAASAMTTPTVNETDTTNMPGVYELLLDEDTTIAAGNDSEEMCLHITHASMAPVTRVIELYRPKITEGNTLTVAADGDLTEVNTLTGHTVQTGDSFARLGAPAGASVSADIAAVPTDTENADALLKRDMSAVSGESARSPLNALRFLRNKWSISGTTLTVTKEDDTTSAWTSTVAGDATADPIVSSDPA